MGLNFRKSMKIAPGIRVNLSKKGLGISGGVRGARISRSATGKLTGSTGIPGSGISYRKSIKLKSEPTINLNSSEQQINNIEIMPQVTTQEILVERKPRLIWTIILGLILLGAIGADFGNATPEGPSRISSITYSLFILVVFSYRVYRHKKPRLRKITRVVPIEESN